MDSFAIHVTSSCLLLFYTATAAANDVDRQPIRAPVPLELVGTRPAGVDTTRIDFTPDGAFITYSEVAGEALDPPTAATGVPPPVGQKSRVVVVDAKTGTPTYSTDPAAWSWAPKWSPDGRRLAFYSDLDGKARIWVWNKETNRASAISNLTPRPANRTEMVRWAADGRRLYLKASTNDSDATKRAAPPGNSPRKAGAPPAVIVVKARTDNEDEMGLMPVSPSDQGASDAPDLVELDLATNAVKSIARATPVNWFDVSPNDRYVGYMRPSTRPAARLRTSFVTNYFDLMVYDRNKQTTQPIAEHLALNPTGCNWSPDSRYLACVPYRSGVRSRAANTNELLIVAVPSGEVRRIAQNLTVLGALSSGSPPSALWQADSRAVYVVGSDAPPTEPAKWYNESRSDQLWRADLSRSNAVPVSELPGQTITGVFTSDGRTVWSEKGARAAWIFAKDPNMSRGVDAVTGLYRIDLATGKASRKLDLAAGWPADVGAAAKGNTLGYTADSLRAPGDVWTFDVSLQRGRQLTHLNPEWERYDLGGSQLLEYRDADGRPLQAGLVLPPGYEPGQKLPLIVIVYGLARDATLINNFALHGTGSNNMHVLSTRGYALLVPDMPLRQGTQLKDVLGTVMPAVDEAIAQGIVDPERMAVLGFSFGAYTGLGLVLQTDRFKAACINGVSLFPDLFTDYLFGAYRFSAGNPDFQEDTAPYGLAMDGNPWVQRQRYVENSVATYFDKLETPLLMAQGTKDAVAASGAVFGSLRALGKDVEYLIYEGEDHAIVRKENIIDLWNRRIEFFDQHLNISRNSRGEIEFVDAHAQPRS